MKIAVFGATGSTGKEVVERAIASGHEVVAIVRKQEALVSGPNLQVHLGDVLDQNSFLEALKDVDGVISCIGPANNFSPGTLVSNGTSNIVEACEKIGVRRFVMQSGITLSDGRELSVFNRIAVRLLRKIYWKAGDDKAIAENLVKKSSLDWVILRPVGLKDSPALGKHTAGPRAKVKPFDLLPFSNCAESNLRALTEAAWTRQIINVGR